MLPHGSITARSPGAISVVELASSIKAGPAISVPAARCGRHRIRVSNGRAASSNTTGRCCSVADAVRLPRLGQPAADRVLHARHGHDEAQVDHLDRLIGRGMAVAPIVLRIEARTRALGRAGQFLRSGDGDGNRVLLAAIAQIGGEVEFARR